VRASSAWIGAKGRRVTTIVFVLPRAARVMFTITQVFPTCRDVAHFSLMGHAGVNRFRFAGKVRGRPLAAGTYRIALRTVGGGSVKRITIVVVGGTAPGKTELAVARAANACAAGRDVSGVSGPGELASASGVSSSLSSGLSATDRLKGANTHSGVLASTAEQAARAIRPVLLAVLALSILLLGLASLPQPAVPGPRLTDMLARHRLEIAGAGVAALAGVVIAFAFG
jgi:hypothetical protein